MGDIFFRLDARFLDVRFLGVRFLDAIGRRLSIASKEKQSNQQYEGRDEKV